MNIPRRRFLSLAGVGAVFAATATIAKAQSYPVRPVHLIVGFPAGGPNDILGRLMGQWLSGRLDQPVIVENRPGASGNIATEAVVRAPADGYMLLLVGPANAINPSIYDNLNHSFLRDIAPVAAITREPLIMLVHPSVPAKSVPEFIVYAKANQATMRWGSAGSGSASHVSCILFNAVLGVDVTMVPYRGLAPAMQDLIAGRIDYLCDSVSTSMPQIESKSVKAIATTGSKRSAVLADVPTAREQGLDFDVSTWQGLFLPKGVPEPIVHHLNQALGKALDMASVRDRFEGLGEEIAAPERRSPEYFAKFVAKEIERWSGPIKASGASVD